MAEITKEAKKSKSTKKKAAKRIGSFQRTGLLEQDGARGLTLTEFFLHRMYVHRLGCFLGHFASPELEIEHSRMIDHLLEMVKSGCVPVTFRVDENDAAIWDSVRVNVVVLRRIRKNRKRWERIKNVAPAEADCLELHLDRSIVEFLLAGLEGVE
jgi:hypothetical protein